MLHEPEDLTWVASDILVRVFHHTGASQATPLTTFATTFATTFVATFAAMVVMVVDFLVAMRP